MMELVPSFAYGRAHQIFHALLTKFNPILTRLSPRGVGVDRHCKDRTIIFD